jgi:hypothetical protein
MAKQIDMASQPATERETAPVTAPAVAAYVPPVALNPRQMQVERQGDISSSYTRRFPEVRGGICEYCGVLDGNQPSEYQYKLCPHYRGMQLRCTYCPAEKNPDDVINHTVLKIAEHPDNPNRLVVWCDSYECSKKHIERFRVSTS